MTLVNQAKKAVAFLLSLMSVLMLLSPMAIRPLDAQNLRLSVDILADTHVGPAYGGGSVLPLVPALSDMKRSQVQADVLVIAGDMTENAAVGEYRRLSGALERFCGARQILPAMGNHDARGVMFSDETFLHPYEVNRQRYLDFLKETAGIETDTVYFSQVIKGYTFIVLNTEATERRGTALSAQQLQWLDSVLAGAVQGGKPVFVVNHQPPADVGDEEQALLDILMKYDGTLDLFYIFGHRHTGFNDDTVTNAGTIRFVEVPSFGKTPDGTYNKIGTGLHVEVYDGETVLRARDYLRGVWVSEFDISVSLLPQATRSGSGADAAA